MSSPSPLSHPFPNLSNPPAYVKGLQLSVPGEAVLNNLDLLVHEQPKDPHTITVSIVGAPNAGKSMLINLLLKDKVSAVSGKSHTTRQPILGVLTQDNKQVVIHDTPGIIGEKDMKR